MRKFLKKFKPKKILSIVLSLLIILGVGAGIVKLIQFATKTTNNVVCFYSVGSLNSVGEYDKNSDKSKIYTKDYFECMGLTITPNFDARVSYQVFLYDKDGNYLNKTNELTSSYKLNTNYARYARIVINPDEDDNILFYEIYKYSSQIKVEVSKNQNFRDYKNISLTPKCEKVIGNSIGKDSAGLKVVESAADSKSYYKLNINEFNKVRINFRLFSSNVTCLFTDANGNIKDTFTVSSSSAVTEVVPTGATTLFVNCNDGDIVDVFEEL